MLPSVGNPMTVSVVTLPRFPHEKILCSPVVEPTSIQYADAPEPAVQPNVTLLPASTEPGFGAVITPAAAARLNDVYLYAWRSQFPFCNLYSVTETALPLVGNPLTVVVSTLPGFPDE